MQLSIRARLLGGSGVLVLIAAIACVTGYIQSRRVKALVGESQRANSNAVQEIMLAKDSNRLLQGARIVEREFVAKPTDKLVQEHAQVLQELDQKLQQLAAQNPARKESAEGCRAKLQDYQQAFGQLVQQLSERGFTHESGLQARFRQAAHAVESKVTPLGKDALLVSALTIRRNEKDYQLRGDAKYVTAVYDKVKLFRDQLGQLDVPPELQAELHELWITYEQAFAAVVSNQDAILQSLQRLETSSKQSGDSVDAFALAIADEGKQTQARVAGNLSSTLSMVESTMLAVLVVSVLIGTVIALATAYSILKPIGQVVELLRQMAAGDLRGRLQIRSRDELGAMANAFNQTAESLQSLIGMIAGNSQQLAKNATDMAATSQELEASADEALTQANRVSGSVESMNADLAQMTHASEEMSVNFRSVAAASEEMTATIREIAQNAERASSVAEQATQLSRSGEERMRSLEVSANEIGKVIEVIQDIADQTNLLALNATIEAARAGESGRGFAVVAGEVKELAQQTSTATEDIRRRILSIQSSSREATQAMTQISQVVGGVREASRSIAAAVEEQSVTTNEIARNVSSTSSAASSVSERVVKSAAACGEVDNSVRLVNSSAQRTAASAAQTRTTGRQLHQLSERLQDVVARFQA